MRKILLFAVLTGMLATGGTALARVDVGVGINVGVPAPPVPVAVVPAAPAPVVVVPAAPPAPVVVVPRGDRGRHLGHYRHRGWHHRHHH
ncbi:MAG TPA: hypothetical protein VFG19_00380 [Geobacteraceae bacterium]|nr:hypothetical protein [Geobacteraceae bacterium]